MVGDTCVRLTRQLAWGDGPGVLCLDHPSFDDRSEHVEINVGEFVDVQALLEPSSVLAQLLQELRLACKIERVDDQVRPSWTEADDARRSGVSRIVLVVIPAEADDRRTQHLRFPASGLLETL